MSGTNGWLVIWTYSTGGQGSCVLASADAAQRLVKSFCDSGHEAECYAYEVAPCDAVVQPISRERAIEIAQSIAFLRHDEHLYLPTNEAAAAQWQPHEWVIGAIRVASKERP